MKTSTNSDSLPSTASNSASGNFLVSAVAALAPLAVGAVYPPDARNHPEAKTETSGVSKLSPTSTSAEDSAPPSGEHSHQGWLAHALHHHPHHHTVVNHESGGAI
ncbi:hypothetical protein F503_07083 [Ophiostoma piceae UAMH 11346]|uniref:Uncharacterized protein n=1 Tax=Ophiostoma piceae (strain UAMH 11346) TaxID=1262450 RepID=S3C8Y6_OPHP1|nr:hypothetical protein F503_07083 [Ophiostoma piceae UAMH 11346]